MKQMTIYLHDRDFCSADEMIKVKLTPASDIAEISCLLRSSLRARRYLPHWNDLFLFGKSMDGSDEHLVGLALD